MATEQKAMQDQQEFADSFNDESAPAPEQSEDAAFGISPDISAESSSDGAGEPPAMTLDGNAADADPQGTNPPEPEMEQVEGAPAEEAMETPAQEAAEPMAEGASTQMTEQQLKSWEGRLKKQQAELDAKNSQPAAEGDAGEIKEVIADVASGEISADEAMSKLSDDFGPEFVSMIVAIANKAAGDTATGAIGDVSRNVDGIISHIKDSAQRAHFEAISDAHPDFMEISAAPEFTAWLATRGDSQAEDKRMLESGTAKEVNSVLAAYKKSTEQADQAKDENNNGEADAAEGVRSGGIQLPAEPTSSDNYEAAWEEA